MNISLNKDEKRSAGITAIIVILLTISFFFVGLKLELPLPKGELEISFGTSDQGSGEVQPDEFTSEEVTDQQQEVAESQSSQATESNTMTAEDNIVEAPQNSEETATVTEEPQDEVVETEKENQTDTETEMLNDLYPQNSSSQESEGVTGQQGDQGDINGSDNTNHDQGFWDGENYFYGGPRRGQAFIPKDRESDCNEQGKVGVIIYINRDGQVIGEPRFTNEGTTNTADCLVKKAIAWAKQIRFEANPQAPVQQKILKICNFNYRQ